MFQPNVHNTRSIVRASSRPAGRNAVCVLLPLLCGLNGCQTVKQKLGIHPDPVYKADRYLDAPQVGAMKDDGTSVPRVTDDDDSKPIMSGATGGKNGRGGRSRASGFFGQKWGAGDPGEQAGGWIGTFDIYFKLNWARKELLRGNVSRDLPDVTRRALAHIERIRHEGMPEKPDPLWNLSPSVTCQACMEPADRAFGHIVIGLEHTRQIDTLNAGGLNWRALPWGMGATEMQRAFQNLGLMPRPDATPAVSTDRSDDDTANTLPRPPAAARASLSLPQQQAIAVALRYEQVYHASPEERARKEFEDALRETLQMRELLNLRYWSSPDAAPGDDVMIVGPLRQESGVLPPTTPTDAPFTSAGAGGTSTPTGGSAIGAGGTTFDPLSGIGRSTGPLIR